MENYVEPKNRTMEIKVSSAASLFKENGHDLKGLYQLFLNAVSADKIASYPASIASDYGSYGMSLSPYVMVTVSGNVREEIKDALAEFTPNAEEGEKRILKFYEDYKRLRELSEKIQPYGFWKILFRANQKLREFLEEKEEIENMKISLNDLLQVAFFKFTQVRGTKKQFVEGFNRYLEL